MSNKLLYYPYINIPKSTWLTKACLYYDQISIISAEGIDQSIYTDHNERLFKEGIIERVYPNQLQYLNRSNLGDHIIEKIKKAKANKIGSIPNDQVYKIHMTKFKGEILNYLIDEGYTWDKNIKGWHFVDRKIGRIIMREMAKFISLAIDSTISTDNLGSLRELKYNYINFSFRRNNLQKILVDRILPYPHTFKTDQIIRFRERNFDSLQNFRMKIEDYSRRLAGYTDLRTLDEELKHVLDEIKDESERIEDLMNQSSFGKILKGNWLSLTTAAVSSILGNLPIAIAAGILNIAKSSTDILNNKINSPIHYVCLMKDEIKKYDP